jgi:hypothetical protein
MAKTIQEYLPESKTTVNVQARIPADLKAKVQVIMDKKKIGWNEVVEACFRKFLDDMAQEDKRKELIK